MFKKRCFISLIILFSILILLKNSNALTVSLNSPLDGTINTTARDMNFTCTVNSPGDLANLTFYANDTLFPSVEKVNDSEVLLDQTYGFYMQNIPNSNYEWNCTATDVNGVESYSENRKYFVFLYIDFIENSNMTWPEDTVNNSLNLSDYFIHSGLLPMTYTWSGNSNIAISESNGIVTLTPNANFTGIETVTFTATETTISNSTIVLLNVTPVNDPPYLKQEFENTSWQKDTDKEINLNDYFTDVDGDVLNYSISGLININATIDNSVGKLTLTPNANWTGTETANITATDSYLTASASITLVVTLPSQQQTNTPPTIDSFSPTEPQITLDLGSSKIFSIVKSDNENDVLTVKWYLDNSLINDATSDTYTFNADKVETYQLKAEISDGTYTAQKTWTLIVKSQTQTPVLENESKSLCGDGSIAPGENCENCPNDVKCKKGEVCIDSKCTIKESINIKVILSIAGGIIAVVTILSLSLHFYNKKKEEGIFKLDKTAPAEKPEPELIKVKSEEPPVEISDYYEPSKKKIVEEPKEEPESKTKSVKLVLLRNYIKDALRKGDSPEKIKKRLLSVGWEQQQIDKILNEYTS